MEEFSSKKPAAPLLISFDAEEVRKQAAASTQRFEEGIFDLDVNSWYSKNKQTKVCEYVFVFLLVLGSSSITC